MLGLLQGLTEFLPISSSGHLILVPLFLGWPDHGLAFDAAVHLGTALALACYFAPELVRLTAGAARGDPADRGLILAVAVATLPAALAGVALEDVVETRLRSATVVALSLIGWGLVLFWADRRARRARVAELRAVGLGRSLLVGCAQALALVPGTSRSGVTVAAGLFAGLDRPTAARFAFLLGLPLTAGAGLFETAGLLRAGIPAGELLPLGLGLAAAFGAGLLAVAFLIRYLQRRTLLVFVVYRVALGLAILALHA